MVIPSVKEALLRELEKLGAADQQRVVDFVRALAASAPRGTPGNELGRFAGAMSPDAVEEMMAAIDEGCERIDDNW
jgi:hypothetical protein